MPSKKLLHRSLLVMMFVATLPVLAFTQLVQQGSKLVGTGATDPAYQGQSVALSADGNTALAGGFFDGIGVGGVWVFTRSGEVWSQEGTKLLGTGAVGNASQGYSVALSDDGNTALVGGYLDNSNAGAAWVFTRSGGVWTQQGSKLVGTDTVGKAVQGYSVALSGDGNTAIIGGTNDNTNVGAAWVFTRSGSTWSQQGSKLVGTGGVGKSSQGSSVSLSASGDTALVGGWNDSSSTGASWIFTRSGSTWTQQGSKLVGSGVVVAAHQGGSVSLSDDGLTAAIGGFANNVGVGAVWIFVDSSGVWVQQGSKLLGTGVNGTARQGASVSLSSDGNTLLEGGWNDSTGSGAAWMFTRSGEAWTQLGDKLVGTGAIGAAQQGQSVCLSSDGTTAIIGGQADNSYAGAAWIFAPVYLPVEMVSFTAAAVGQEVMLHWKTETEVDNYGFEIERREISLMRADAHGFRSQNDGVHQGNSSPWSTIAFVNGSGTSSSPNEYSFSDNNLPAGRYGYRIKQVDRNGSFKYADAVEVEIGLAPLEFDLAQNYPNPFNPSTTLEFSIPHDGLVTLKVFDINGREVATLMNQQMTGGLRQQVVFNASRFSSGTYFAVLRLGSEQLIKRMVLAK